MVSSEYEIELEILTGIFDGSLTSNRWPFSAQSWLLEVMGSCSRDSLSCWVETRTASAAGSVPQRRALCLGDPQAQLCSTCLPPKPLPGLCSASAPPLLSDQSDCISFSREHVLSTHPSVRLCQMPESKPSSHPQAAGWVWRESHRSTPEMMFLKAVVKQCNVVLCIF